MNRFYYITSIAVFFMLLQSCTGTRRFGTTIERDENNPCQVNMIIQVAIEGTDDDVTMVKNALEDCYGKECFIPCPGDSDLQQTVGAAIPDTAPLQRGDLVFWKGHVALLTAPDRIIHANGKTMSVAYEGLTEAITRIDSQGEGPVIARRRPQKPD